MCVVCVCVCVGGGGGGGGGGNQELVYILESVLLACTAGASG